MLTHLHIKNFAIIDNLDLDLKKGLTVVTGETGAGKSIMIGALTLALGARADNQAIKTGAERCEITAVFDVSKIPEAHAWLSKHELDTDDECMVRRVIKRDGPSRCSINGTPYPLTTVRELASTLTHIHSQHQHQALLKRGYQRQIVDAFAGHAKLLASVNQAYLAWADTKQQIEQLTQHTQAGDDRIQLVNHYLSELQQLNLQPGEVEQLHTQYKTLNNAEQLLQSCQEALNAIGDDDKSTLAQLHIASQACQRISDVDNRIKTASELLSNALIHSQEAESELRNYLQQTELDPEKLHEVESRLNLIHDIARKHRVEPEQLTDVITKMENEKDLLENAELRSQELQQALAENKKTYLAAAKKLTLSRNKAAKKLGNAVTQSIQQLGMPQGLFDIALITNDKQAYSAAGLEQIEFQVAANPGQPTQAMSKVASGGELSRISLAIQVIAATKTTVPTLIFDEVDVGIGGGTAEIVGQQLHALAKNAQVLCITHLPQVAAQGDQHLSVSKLIENKTTVTNINELNKEERTQEVARMLGGINITNTTLEHAEEMLKGSDLNS